MSWHVSPATDIDQAFTRLKTAQQTETGILNTLLQLANLFSERFLSTCCLPSSIFDVSIFAVLLSSRSASTTGPAPYLPIFKKLYHLNVLADPIPTRSLASTE